jgi:hypothetical protein
MICILFFVVFGFGFWFWFWVWVLVYFIYSHFAMKKLSKQIGIFEIGRIEGGAREFTGN